MQGHSQCEIACVEDFQLSQFSLIEILTRQAKPSFSVKMVVANTKYDLGPLPFEVEDMAEVRKRIQRHFFFLDSHSLLPPTTAQSAAQMLGRLIRPHLDLNFCITNANCPGSQVCDHTRDEAGRQRKSHCSALCPAGKALSWRARASASLVAP